MVARLACCALILSMANVLFGGAYRTQNFIVQTHSADFAKQVGEFAERYRRELGDRMVGSRASPLATTLSDHGAGRPAPGCGWGDEFHVPSAVVRLAGR